MLLKPPTMGALLASGSVSAIASRAAAQVAITTLATWALKPVARAAKSLSTKYLREAFKSDEPATKPSVVNPMDE